MLLFRYTFNWTVKIDTCRSIFCMKVGKLSSQHRTREPFSATSGFRSVCLFSDPGKFWVSNFDAFIDFSNLTTFWESYITFQPIPQMHGPVHVTYSDKFPENMFTVTYHLKIPLPGENKYLFCSL